MRHVWLIKLKSVEELQKMFDNFGVALEGPGCPLNRFTLYGIRELLKKADTQLSEAELTAAAVSMDNFANQMRMNDFLLLAAGDIYAIGELESNYNFAETGKKQLLARPHYRMVKPGCTGKQEQLPENLRNRIAASPYQVENLSEYEDVVGNLLFHGNYAAIKMRKSMRHIFYPLRSNYKISITVPEDFTKSEAASVADFLRKMHNRK